MNVTLEVGRTGLRRLGTRLGARVQPGDVIALVGDLGAAKTFLAQHIAYGAGVAPGTRVASPTFTVVQEHQGRVAVHHADLYRLSHAEDLREIGLFERGAAGVVLVEWADRLCEVIPDDALWIELVARNLATRHVTLHGEGPRVERLFGAIAATN